MILTDKGRYVKKYYFLFFLDILGSFGKVVLPPPAGGFSGIGRFFYVPPLKPSYYTNPFQVVYIRKVRYELRLYNHSARFWV